MISPDGFYSEGQVAEFFGMTIECLRKKYSTAEITRLPTRYKLLSGYHYNKNEFHAWLENQPKSGGEQSNIISMKKAEKIYEKHQFAF